MEHKREVANSFLVDVFNEILKIEEASIARDFEDISVRDMHVIAAVCAAQDAGFSCSAASIAEEIRVTAGTLTTAVTMLERKGYLIRNRDEKDKRVVHIIATQKGCNANVWHKKFHEEMVDGIFNSISEQEADILIKALKNITAFFNQKYIDHKYSRMRGRKE